MKFKTLHDKAKQLDILIDSYLKTYETERVPLVQLDGFVLKIVLFKIWKTADFIKLRLPPLIRQVYRKSRMLTIDKQTWKVTCFFLSFCFYRCGKTYQPPSIIMQVEHDRPNLHAKYSFIRQLVKRHHKQQQTFWQQAACCPKPTRQHMRPLQRLKNALRQNPLPHHG